MDSSLSPLPALWCPSSGCVTSDLPYITRNEEQWNPIELTRASIFIKGSLKSHLFLIFRNLNHLFSLHAQMDTGIPICHGHERSTEEAMETAERYGCLTIKLAIIAMIRSSLMGLSEQTILSADSQDRVDLRTTGHHQALITRKIRHSAIESNQILYNALHWKDNVAINEPAESVRLHKLICYCHESFLLQF